MCLEQKKIEAKDLKCSQQVVLLRNSGQATFCTLLTAYLNFPLHLLHPEAGHPALSRSLALIVLTQEYPMGVILAARPSVAPSSWPDLPREYPAVRGSCFPPPVSTQAMELWVSHPPSPSCHILRSLCGFWQADCSPWLQLQIPAFPMSSGFYIVGFPELGRHLLKMFC